MTINQALNTTRTVNTTHYSTLMSERTSGSTWGMWMTEEVLASLPWVQLPWGEYVDGVHLPFCKYYTLDSQAMGVHLPNASQHMEVSSQVRKESISVVKGAHGYELVSSDVEGSPCDIAWLIVGPAENERGNAVKGEEMVWTAYPGDITRPIPRDFDGDISTLDLSLDYAVKGV